MGNANSHVHERRKSGGDGGGCSPYVAHQLPPDCAALRETSFTSGPRGSIGPVDITKPSNFGKSPNRLLSTTSSALSRTVRGFRPRGNNAAESQRARANTISGQRPRARRQITVDCTGDAAAKLVEAGLVTTAGEDQKDPNEAASSTAAFVAAVSGKKLPTFFKYAGTAKEVYVCGSFNNWQKLKMSPSTKDFVAIVELAEGEHEYKFIVDGEWATDPNEPTVESTTENGEVVKNNVIRVQKEDFNAYHALDMDSRAVAQSQQNRKKQYADTFSQDIPQYGLQAGSEHRGGPPILPPHLLQVILNKDTPLSCEPTLLPLPRRVMLNHLYALSIKDGVMVLSSSQRYQRKYVTTLLYKPMGTRKA